MKKLNQLVATLLNRQFLSFEARELLHWVGQEYVSEVTLAMENLADAREKRRKAKSLQRLIVELKASIQNDFNNAANVNCDSSTEEWKKFAKAVDRLQQKTAQIRELRGRLKAEKVDISPSEELDTAALYLAHAYLEMLKDSEHIQAAEKILIDLD